MVKYLDRIRVGNNRAVVSYVRDDGTIEVVYKNGSKDIYEDAKLVDGKWTFVNPGPSGGYAQGKDRLQEAVTKLNMSAETRHLLGDH